MGYQAGNLNTTAPYNTFVGYEAGQNSTGDQNTFIGSEAGLSNTTAIENTCLGESAGRLTSTGDQNTFIGEESGWTNTAGHNNVFLGHFAGYYCIGDYNTFIGEYADVTTGTPALTNATSLGWRAKAAVSNTVIIGTDSVLVGIGLSGDPTGPTAKLDVENNATALSLPWVASNI